MFPATVTTNINQLNRILQKTQLQANACKQNA